MFPLLNYWMVFWLFCFYNSAVLKLTLSDTLMGRCADTGSHTANLCLLGFISFYLLIWTSRGPRFGAAVQLVILMAHPGLLYMKFYLSIWQHYLADILEVFHRDSESLSVLTKAEPSVSQDALQDWYQVGVTNKVILGCSFNRAGLVGQKHSDMFCPLVCVCICQELEMLKEVLEASESMSEEVKQLQTQPRYWSRQF